MKVEEIKPRASEGDIVELEGKVSHAQKPNEGQYGWSQFIGVKDDTGEQNCWIRLEGEEDKVTKGTSISIKGKLGEEYKDRKTKEMVRSINNCEFEVVGKVQEPAQSSGGTVRANGNGKDNYWEKKFEWEKKMQIRKQFLIARQCAIKTAVELIKTPIKDLPKEITKKPIRNLFEFADRIVDYIYKHPITQEVPEKVLENVPENTKEERIEEAREVVGDTEFRPASIKQKNYIFGYRNEKDEFCKGIIDSIYMETPEKREIGDPKKLSLKDASEWLLWWWGPDKKSGERAKREKEKPLSKVSKEKETKSIVKGDKTSVAKDVLVDDINAWRRENFLIDDKKFKEELGYNPDLEKLSEEDLLKIKELTKHYHPKSWDK